MTSNEDTSRAVEQTFESLIKLTKLSKKLRQNSPTTIPASEPGTFLSDVQELSLKWLWENRILLGKLTLLDGDPDLGKSLITLDLAARVTTGRPMPDGTPGIQGNVILIAPEDNASDTIKPRVLAAGGDPSRIRLLTFIDTPDPQTGQSNLSPFTLPTHLVRLIQCVQHNSAALVIIDPLISVLDRKISVSRDQDMRSILSWLTLLARHSGCAILLVRHLNKGTLNNPLYRGSGSIGIIASARSGLLVVQDPHDANKRILTTSKNNLSAKAPNLTYNITSNADGIPTINWLGTSHIPLSHLLKSNSNLSSARQTILNVLHDSAIPLGPKSIAEQTGQKNDPVRLLLRRMLDAQEITSPSYGLYTVHGRPSPNTPPPHENSTPSNETTQPQYRRGDPLWSPGGGVAPDDEITSPDAIAPNGGIIPPDAITPNDSISPDDDITSPDAITSPDDTTLNDSIASPDAIAPPDTFTPNDVITSPTNPPSPSTTPPQPIAPTPAQTPVITQATLDALTKKIRTIFYCTRDIHYVQWLIFARKIGCPLCDSWLVKDTITNPATLVLYETLYQHSPRENEPRQAWLERIAPFIQL